MLSYDIIIYTMYVQTKLSNHVWTILILIEKYWCSTEFVHACVKKILSMYKNAADPPKSVVLVGHSMVRNEIILLGLFVYNVNIFDTCIMFLQDSIEFILMKHFNLLL